MTLELFAIIAGFMVATTFGFIISAVIADWLRNNDEN